MFHPWPQLPTELKLEVLNHAVSQARPIDHNIHSLSFARKGPLGTLVGTRNREIAQLSVEACKPFPVIGSEIRRTN